MDALIIAKMRTFKEWKHLSFKDVEALIVRGHDISIDDNKSADSGTIRSHYDLSDFDKEAMATSAQYDIMVQFTNDKHSGVTDEEE